jgi:hypothetical protein
MNESRTAMTACYILRIRSDHSTTTAAALTTRTPGLFIARATAPQHGHNGRFDQCPDNPSRCPHHVPTWYPRLSCGYALGDYGCPSLPDAIALAEALGRTEIDWTQDYPALRELRGPSPSAYRRRALAQRLHLTRAAHRPRRLRGKDSRCALTDPYSDCSPWPARCSP